MPDTGLGSQRAPERRRLRLLVAEAEEARADAVRSIVEDLGHQVCALARTAAEAEAVAGQVRPDLALMGVRLAAGGDGIDAARRLHVAFGLRSVFLTGYADHQTMRRITESYPLGFVHHPFSSSQIKSVLDLAARRLRV